MEKKCSKCKKCKAIHDFYKEKGKPRSECKKCNIAMVLKGRNPEKHKKSNKNWASRHPDRIRDLNLRMCYGITLIQYNEILASQNGMCAVCNATDSGPSRKGSSKMEPLYVDHCHQTGKIRGLLCRKHNTGLGYFSDDISILQRIIDYLKKEQHAAQTNRDRQSTGSTDS